MPPLKRLIKGFAQMLILASSLSAWPQTVPESMTIELVNVSRQYAEDSSLDTARGEEFALVEAAVEFADGGDIDRVRILAGGAQNELEEDGDRFALQRLVGSLGGAWSGDWTLTVEPFVGDPVDYEIPVGFLDFPNPPEVRFPIDGLDQLERASLEAEWTGSGDSSRLDLQELDSSREVPESTIRTQASTADLGSLLSSNTAYELWIGETRTDSRKGSLPFPVEVRFTRSLYLQFSTGPNPRQQIPGLSVGNRIDAARCGLKQTRYGQSQGAPIVSAVVAELEGADIEEVEVVKIQGPEDGRMVGSFLSAAELEPSSRFEREMPNLSPGDWALFLVEFSGEQLGAEVRNVENVIFGFPTVSSPKSNASGLGPEIPVAWDYPYQVDEFRVVLTALGGPPHHQEVRVPPDTHSVLLHGVPLDRDFTLEVIGVYGASQRSSLIRVSTFPAGDVDGDGRFSGRDMFLLSLALPRAVHPQPGALLVDGYFRLDVNGDEHLNRADLPRNRTR
ncbi:MAG: hypothetical protein GHCLOJNM_01406 [bacterium]|nr:hypothetical protein [bacterium]